MWKKIKGNNMDVKIIFICLFIIVLSFSYAFLKNNDYLDASNLDKSIYNYDAKSIDGELIKMSKYKGKKIIIVNVASKCGYTYQYEGLQSLYEKYKGKVEILAFPSNDFLWQEPGKNAAIKTFCSTKYGVEFQLFEKVVVKKKKDQHPIYAWLSNENLNGWNDAAPSWNFNKFLIDENGTLVKLLSASTKPFDKEIISFLEDLPSSDYE